MTETKEGAERDRCGWTCDYDEPLPYRCALRAGHGGDHDPKIHGYGKFTDTLGGIPPAALLRRVEQ